MRVLAIDPGYDRLGIAVVEKTPESERLMYSACIETDRAQEVPDRLHAIGAEITRLMDTYAPDTVAIEKLFFNKNQTTAMAVAEVRGMILYLARSAGCPVYEFGPQEIKVAVTGYGKSDKKQVTAMVTRLLPSAPRGARDDEYDAIAIALTALAHHRD